MWIPCTAALLMLAGFGGEADTVDSRAADVHRPRLRLVGPVSGAVVWGRFAVGAELRPGQEEWARAEVRLLLPDGSELAPVRSAADAGSLERHTFEVDAAALPAGPLRLVAVASGGGDVPLASGAVELTVAHPGEGELVRGECEEALLAERPEAFGADEPRVGSRRDASGGGFVAVPSGNPAWVLPFEVPADGRYQVFVVARGDAAAGAFPSVGLCVDRPNEVRTAARLVDRTWHRLPVGTPVALEQGTRHLSVRFLNDFYLPNTADRNLYLDRYELLRVEAAGESSGAGAMAMMAAMDSMSGGGAGGVRIGLARPLDGLPVNGRLKVEGFCRWTDMEATPAPRVELVLNGRPIWSQQATRPVFAIDRAELESGPNTIQLRARLPDGRSGSTPVETVLVGGAPRPAAPLSALHRFSVVDQAWDDTLRGMLTGAGEEPGHRVAAFLEPEVARLTLPEGLAGEFDLIFEARGPGQQAVVLEVTLETPAESARVGGARIQNWWGYRPGGTVTLAPGPKTLAVVLGDGSPEPRTENEQPLVRSLILREPRPEDRGAPWADVRYPPAGQVVHGVDAVVVEAWDEEDRLAQGDVWIDGVQQHVFGAIPDGAGWAVFPLIARELEPGPHVLSVRVEDSRGNVGESLEVPFIVAAQAPPELGTYDRAVRLLSRFGYGPEPQQLAAVLLEGERAWLERSLAERGVGDRSAQARAEAEMNNLYDYAVTRAGIQHSILSNNPAWTRFVWWTENHFSTWIRKSGAGPEWREHETFLRLGPTSFLELLTASATSSAMLVYLDQRESYAGRLNENYAREIMELHTLGVDGGYDQADVTELAGLLAGLTLTEQSPLSGAGNLLAREFHYAPELADGREREVLGEVFERAEPDQRWTRAERALALLARHPSTARHVAHDLAAHYVAAPPPADLVDELAAVFTGTGGDMRALLLALAEHPALYDPELAPRAMSPMEFGFRLARVTENGAVHWAVHTYLNRAGQACFDRPTPDGYPEDDQTWTDTNVTLQRWALPRDAPWAVGNLVPQPLRSGSAGDVEAWHQRVVDVVAWRLTGALLGEASNRAALEFFAALEGPPWEQVNQLAVLVAQLPEAGME